MLMFLAERRAQLSRSRSRQNLFQASASPDVVREINFDDDSVLQNNNSKDSGTGAGAKPQQRKTRNKGERTGNSGVGSMSEAEELLKRLKEL